MNSIFLSHFRNQNLIDLYYAKSSFIIIIIILFLVILLTLTKNQNVKTTRARSFNLDTSTTLKGIAIIILILGHFSQKCTQGIIPFELTGVASVIIFLTISGLSMIRTYGLDSLGNIFILRRIKRLIFPVWITLALFYLLNYFLLDWEPRTKWIILNFLGLIRPCPPNGPAWFITYILFLYANYYLVSLLRISNRNKCITLLVLSYISLIIIHTSPLSEYFGIWKSYSIVFPVAVLIGFYLDKVYNVFGSIYKISPFFYMASTIFLVMIYYFIVTSPIANMVESPSMGLAVTTLNAIFFIMSVIMISYLIDNSDYRSSFLLTLGNYSFEIYLLHLPFMVYYDFFLFRKPLALYFLIYLAVIITLSYTLRKMTTNMNKFVFRKFQT